MFSNKYLPTVWCFVRFTKITLFTLCWVLYDTPDDCPRTEACCVWSGYYQTVVVPNWTYCVVLFEHTAIVLKGQTTWCHISESSILHSHSYEKPRSQGAVLTFAAMLLYCTGPNSIYHHSRTYHTLSQASPLCLSWTMCEGLGCGRWVRQYFGV
jgi:hypothetical protein